MRFYKERQPVEGGGDNRIFGAMRADDRQAVGDAVQSVSFHTGDLIQEEGHRIARVCFPVSAVLSKVAMLSTGSMVELAPIGYEGMSGFELALECDSASHTIVCQVPGEAYCLDAATFKRLLMSAPSLRSLTLRFVNALVKIIGQSVACNAMHPINQRCARWLLAAHDRARRDTFELTHEFLATMLGTGRPSVSVAAATLQEAGFIKYTRGIVTVLNREGLEHSSCECFASNRETQEQIFS